MLEWQIFIFATVWAMNKRCTVALVCTTQDKKCSLQERIRAVESDSGFVIYTEIMKRVESFQVNFLCTRSFYRPHATFKAC